MSLSEPAKQRHALQRLEDWVSGILTWLLTGLFGLIFLIVTLLVILRYGFSTTIVGASEATVMMFIYTTALGAAVDLARGKHIRIDALLNSLPPALQRWIEGLNLILIGALHCMLLVYSWDWISMVGNSEDPVLHVPEGIFEIAIPIGCVFAVLFCGTRLAILFSSPRSNASNEAV
ncbi:TRAP transporter small permease [uncultured Cohaesibacter sp.]|uniref:TRAP transporter small permease n=1 Tax=uncultured Cohaesibacter sp. TaxID=1002546 RepID=UPI0029C66380|nr:TRAP transporter small permease [uncultured Cohaesibacter sp.]